MSYATLIIGESGTGKSSSLRHLNPQETFIINVLDKPLPFAGAKKRYTLASSVNNTGNYFCSDRADHIKATIDYVNNSRPEMKNLVIDDFQYVMANEFMRNAKIKGYEKFTDLAFNAWSIVRDLIATRPTLNCFVFSHTDTDATGRAKCKTIGKMLDDKITLEGMFTLVLHSMIVDGHYKFLTQNDGSHVAKSPMGMFKDRYIDNDLSIVNAAIENYINEDINL